MSAARKLGKALRVLGAVDRLWLRALRLGVAPGLEHLRVLRLMALEMVVDIGANRGQFALAARHVFPQARIVSFEPLPGPAAVWWTLFGEDRRAQLVNAAVGPQAGGTEMHVSTRDDSSSLLPITARQNALFPGTGEAGTASIAVLRLADALDAGDIAAPALLKLDVQGYELSALQGCEGLLDRFAWVYVECSFVELYAGQAFADEVIAWLRERGFTLAGVYNMAFEGNGRAVQADFLFARKATPAASEPR